MSPNRSLRQLEGGARRTPKMREQRKSRAKTVETEQAPRDRWLVSYADLVTLLLALFIVLFAASDQKRAAKIVSAMASQFNSEPREESTGGNGVLPGSDSLVETRDSFERALAGKKDLQERTRVSITERGLVVSLTEAGFFAPGESEMRADAQPLLDAIADVLNNSKLNIRIEGHTDSTPISTSRFPSNWELSSARATTVLSHLLNRGVSSTRLSVAGYAGERPIADNSTADGRAMNRRVDIVVVRK